MGTTRITEFTAKATFADLPPEVVVVAKRGILDFMGVALGGSREPAALIILDYVKGLEAKGEASVIGTSYRTASELAALANGTASHALDYDDIFANATGYNLHPSVAILPAVLGLADKLHSPGERVITAYVVGLEVAYRLGAAIGLTLAEVGWHSASILGTVGAAAASANLMGLNKEQAEVALGISGSLSGGLIRNFGTMTKPMHAGNGARAGVVAASLAAGGFSANTSVMEDRNGLCGMFTEGRRQGLDEADADLGKTWDIVQLGLAFKLHPSCRSTNAAIDAAIYLREKFGLRPADVQEITCKLNPIHLQLARFIKPQTGYQAKFSIPFCIALALGNGRVLLSDFTDENVADERLQNLLNRVKFVHPKGWGKGPLDLATELEIMTRDGRKYSHLVSLPKGEPQNPLSDEELARKFEMCASLVIKSGILPSILDRLQNYEKLQDASHLLALIAAKVDNKTHQS
ncbi:MAG: MmgE/PrpD family protein [Chloroflexi bacterium]|nr:MmgE/PrpD family protein [Chloroflexota bacterium]